MGEPAFNELFQFEHRTCQADAERLDVISIEIDNFLFLEELYGPEKAEAILTCHELGLFRAAAAHLGEAASPRILRVDPGRFAVVFRPLGEGGELAEQAVSVRLTLKSLVKPELFALIGHVPDVSVGYSHVQGGLAENAGPAFTAALSDARRVAKTCSGPAAFSLLTEFRAVLDAPDVRAVYQPIIDLRSGSVAAWEALARGPAAGRFESPAMLFDYAEEVGLIFALEKACREVAIAGFGPADDGRKLFLNIHPRTLADPSFTPGETRRLLARHGLSPGDVVLEITERHSTRDFALFHRTLEHYRGEGFRLAVDDVGAGYSGLRSIAEIRPEFIKIDMGLVRGVDASPVKRALLETFVTFAEKVGCRIIAEGIETEMELSCLTGMGVHYGQGYLLSRPASPRPNPAPDVVALIRASHRREGLSGKCSLAVASLARPATVMGPEATVEDVQEVFSRAPNEDSLVVVEEGRPKGLVMRHQLERALASKYGQALYGKRPVLRLADSQFLQVDVQAPVETVAKAATSRGRFRTYDHVVVTRQGLCHGVVSVQCLLDALACVQVEMAKGANPLTGLPGNVAIEREVERLSRGGRPCSFIYADLDHFKVYNDVYGFKDGDAMILLLARVLGWALGRHGGSESFLGHVGGDDFVLVAAPDRAERVCRAVVRVFGRLVKTRYSQADRQRGRISARGRDGVEGEFPLVSVSLAIVDCQGNCSLSFISHKAAELKKWAKSLPGNNFVRDRRTGGGLCACRGPADLA